MFTKLKKKNGLMITGGVCCMHCVPNNYLLIQHLNTSSLGDEHLEFVSDVYMYKKACVGKVSYKKYNCKYRWQQSGGCESLSVSLSRNYVPDFFEPALQRPVRDWAPSSSDEWGR